MTTAGLTVLALALDRVSGNDREKPYVGRASKALEEGWRFLERRFTVDSDLDGAHAYRENGHLYFLYGLERVCALLRRRTIAGRDWYAEGARRLVSIQGPDGSWYGTTEDTATALLFLRKATATRLGEDVVLWFGHDDGARVVLDGRVVHERHFHEGAAQDRWHVAAGFAAGPRRLLVKVEEWVGGRTGFFLRVARPDGSDAPEVVPTLSPATPDAAEEARLRPDATPLAEFLRLLPVDRGATLDFGTADDVDRVVVQGCARGWPVWFSRPQARPGQPHPGAAGFLAVHPWAPDAPARVLRRLRLPAGFPLVRVRASADPYEAPAGVGDFVLRVGAS